MVNHRHSARPDSAARSCDGASAASAALLASAALFASAAAPGAAAQDAGARLYDLDTAGSVLFVVTHRAGLLSFLGHDHAILPEDWAGTLCWSADDPAAARASVTVEAASLTIDTDSARALAGLGRPPSDGQLRSIRDKFLAPDQLDAAGHPRMSLEIDTASPADEDDRLEVEGRLTIRGVTRPVRLPLTLSTVDHGALRLAGVLRVNHTDFGMRPESVAGVVRVADPVDIHFNLLARPTNAPCP